MNKDNVMVKNFAIVLNLPIDSTYSDIHSYFEYCLNCIATHNDFYYWGIVHDNDVNENGELKTPHIHLVLKSPVRKRKQTIINYLSNILDVNANTISVDFSHDLLNSITYLTHLNNSDKYQYDRLDIKTNDWTTLDNAYSDIRKGLTIEYLVDLCQSSDYNAIQVFLSLGLDYSSKYRNLIETICKYGSMRFKNVK